jgi:hypothetical protein
MSSRSRARAWTAIAPSLLLVAACDVGQSPDKGLDEPIVVQGGQFISGALPGRPPLAEDAATPVAPDAGFPALSVVNVKVVSPNVPPGMASKSLSGDVSDDTAAVGVRFADMGTGYWVVPAGSPDALTVGALSFSMSAGFNANTPPGNHTLRFVAIGGAGNAGTQFDLEPPLCIDSRIPDNGHACTPDIAPPAAVFTLEWDTGFDLDMHVVTPIGAFDTKMRVGEQLEAGADRIPPDQPFIDRDSLRNCVPDALHQEDLIFPQSLPKGTYYVFVDPFAACGQNAVHFTYTIYQSAGACPACNLQAKTSLTRSGELLASEVTGGTSPPTFVEEFVVQ